LTDPSATDAAGLLDCGDVDLDGTVPVPPTADRRRFAEVAAEAGGESEQGHPAHHRAADSLPIAPWAGLLVTVVWAAAALTIAEVVVDRRDA
jgi:hypothetical protein